jgi:hypothetical protein
MAQTKAETAAATGAPAPAKPTWDEFRALIKRAEGGDRKALPRLRELLGSGANPSWSAWFAESYGNPPGWLKAALIESASGKGNLAIAEAIDMRLEEVRLELEGTDPTPMERLLAERAAYCWFLVNYYETIYTQSRDLTLRQAEFHQRRIDAAHKRFLSAVATLARVRKLALPALQVNVAQNQVNITGGG